MFVQDPNWKNITALWKIDLSQAHLLKLRQMCFFAEDLKPRFDKVVYCFPPAVGGVSNTKKKGKIMHKCVIENSYTMRI